MTSTSSNPFPTVEQLPPWNQVFTISLLWIGIIVSLAWCLCLEFSSIHQLILAGKPDYGKKEAAEILAKTYALAGLQPLIYCAALSGLAQIASLLRRR